MKKLLYFFFVSLIISCSPKSLGYFEIDPFFKPTVNKFDESLYIDFSNHIKDDFAVSQTGMRTLNVSEFKQSLRFALKNTFDDQFKSVEFYNEEPKGFVLKLFRIEPTWWASEIKHMIRKEFKDTISYRDFGCNIKYECTLYYNNEKVSEANGEVRSTRDLYSMQNIEEVFRSAVKLSCENIARQISERK
ncbi:MAG: hypothetical protein WCO28_00310 [Bacteroidota bacterium]